jgi:hypothetical protein
MTLDVFKRMTQGVLSRLGEGSFLRTTVPCSVALEHGVETYGLDAQGNQVAYLRSIATIDSDLAPKVGDALTHPDGNYVLDVIHADDGMSVDFIVRKA